MKKNLKYILIMLLVLLVLGGAAAALLYTPAEEEGEVSSAVEETSSSVNETITNRETEEVKAVVVENADGGFVLVPAEESGFTVQGYEDFPVNTSTARSTVDALASLQIAKDLGERSDLSDFGLEGDEAVTVELQYTDGTSDKLILGNTPGETSGRYVYKDGIVYIGLGISDILYTDGFEYFSSTLYTIDDRTETTTDDDGETTTQTVEDILYSLKLSGTNFPDPIEISYDKRAVSLYLVTSPICAESGNNAMTEVMDDLKALSNADSVVAARLDEAVLEKFGLKEPAAIAEFNLNGAEHTVSVSTKQENGKRYLLLDDNDMIYQVGDSTVSSWADSTLMKLRQGYIWLANIMKVEKTIFTVEGDMVYEFTTTRELNEDRSTETNPYYDLTVKNTAGETVDYETYQDFYQEILSIAVMDVTKAEPTGEPAWEICYQYFDGGEDVISFYPAEEGRYIAMLNGEFNGIVRKSDADKLVEKLPEISETLAQE